MDSSGLVEAVDPGHYRIAGARDVHPIVDHTAGMGDPLVATHELVFRGVAEGVAHTAVAAGDADAGLADGGAEGLLLVLRELAGGPDGDDEVELAQRGLVVERVERVAEGDVEPVAREDAAE